MKKTLPYFSCYYIKLKIGFLKKPPLKIWFLLSIWVPMKLKIKIFLEKLTQVISQFGMKHGLSGIHNWTWPRWPLTLTPLPLTLTLVTFGLCGGAQCRSSKPRRASVTIKPWQSLSFLLQYSELYYGVWTMAQPTKTGQDRPRAWHLANRGVKLKPDLRTTSLYLLKSCWRPCTMDNFLPYGFITNFKNELSATFSIYFFYQRFLFHLYCTLH